MKTYPIFQVDAFTSQLFGGNPAAVCLLDDWIDESKMQSIAAENNLAETAFVVAERGAFAIRWFTPTTEVDLCGHATLAAAHVIFEEKRTPQKQIGFQSRSGMLKVSRFGETLVLDFPVDELRPAELPVSISDAIAQRPLEVFKGKTDFMLVFERQSVIESIEPDFAKLGNAAARGVIVTAPGIDVDFVSRFFAPMSGIDEDPVTGSAHTTLTPYWSMRLGRLKLTAKQLSRRGGYLECELLGDRVAISGQVVTYLRGEIEV